MQEKSIPKRLADALRAEHIFWLAVLSLIIWLVSALILVLVLAQGAYGETCITKGATRTFMQLWRKDVSRTAHQWDQWFEDLNRLGINEVIVQWSSYGSTSFYIDTRKGRESSPSLMSFVMAAQRHQKKVWLGLEYDPSFWQTINNDRVDLDKYFQARLAKIESSWPFLLRTLKRADPKEVTVKGWYISDEIDDIHWRPPYRRNILQTYLKNLRQLLLKQKKSWPVLISGFSNGAMPAEKWAVFWEEMLQETRINGFLFQDGIGAAKLRLTDLEAYLKFASNKISEQDQSFGVIVEIFESIQGNTGDSDRRAAKMSRVGKQLALARKYSAMPITLFSVPDYLNSNGDQSSRKLFTAWQNDFVNCK